ncbi:MAG: MmgE/PrpD family protein [Rubrivivax sp.]
MNAPLPSGATAALATSITAQVAAFAARADASRFPASALAIARCSLLDWAAVGRAGVDEPVARIVREWALADGGRAQARAFGSAQALPARAAALVNGAASHALDYDDTHFDYIGHPSVAVFPAALAMAEATGASGAAFLDAALVGLETACRVGRWLGMSHYQHGFHQTATSGSFGAAAACARLLGLDEERTAHALGIAATRAAGLKSQFGTMGKPYHAGTAASNGVEAAQLAAAGFVSRPDALECEQGFGDTHAGAGTDLSVVLASLGEVFRFEKVQYKLHACCHGTHAALEALATLRAAHATAPDDIERITLTVHPRWLRVCNLELPRTGLEAKFSYRLTAAMVLCGLPTGALDTYTEAACERPDLVALRDRVRVDTDESLPSTAARVAVQLRDGRELTQAHDLDAEVPLAAQQAKLRAKAAALVGVERAERLWTAVQGCAERPARELAAVLVG